MASKTLSKKSPFEQTFKARHRGPGRPGGDDTFTRMDGAHPVIKLIARRRAFSVVHEEQKARLDEIYLSELDVLKRRGVEVAAEDAGISLKDGED